MLLRKNASIVESGLDIYLDLKNVLIVEGYYIKTNVQLGFGGDILNVIFLDFDGVVNIPWWYKNEKGEWKERYNYPHDGTVNNSQAIQWVSDFCEKYNYNIVVSSTWRMGQFDYRKCLYDSGLREGIKILGATPILHIERGHEITKWLEQHPEVENYLIFDDDSDMTIHMDRLVKCDCVVGFTLNQYNYARSVHEAFKKIS